MDYIADVKKYFYAVEARESEWIMALFEEDCEIFFADFGVITGKEQFLALNKTLLTTIKELHYYSDEFIYTEQANRVVVEGAEFGNLYSGEEIKDNKFCSVFQFNPQTGLIQRMFAYTDPNFGIKGRSSND